MIIMSTQNTPVNVSDDEFVRWIWCAVSYNRRIPGGEIPPVIKQILDDRDFDWIEEHRDQFIDIMGAQVKP